MRQNDRLNMLYTKHFYGFEREGKSESYLEKQVQPGSVFTFKYPLRMYDVQDKVLPLVATGLRNVDFLMPKTDEQLKEEAKQAEELQRKIDAMTPVERRKYEL